ncbi:MAG: chromosome segregation protein SMC [Bacillota bacterium]
MLRKLSLRGFKSFCDKTDVILGSGITAIVGPNGCGKSNLADALRWVLGEQNPRVLRSMRQQDVIFAGTERRKAMGMAEVKLLFDGIDGHNGSEIEIERRLTRDGTSEYRINGKVVRWKDIVEILSGTGLSHTGYVVIGQGMVQELVSGRPEDRRTWIEEASGVAKVKISKKETESRLEAAKADIARLDDLLVELEARRAQLSQDRDVASRYHSISRERRAIEISMWLYQSEDETRKIDSLSRRIEKGRVDLQFLQSSIPAMSRELAALRQQSENADLILREISKDRDEALASLVSLEKRRDSLRSQCQVLGRELESRQVRRQAIQRDLARVRAEDESLEKSLELLASKQKSAQDALRAAEETRVETEAHLRELGANVIGVRKATLALASDLSTCQRAREDIRRNLEGKQRELSSLKQWIDTSKERVLAEERELASLSEQSRLAEYRLSEALEEQETVNSSRDGILAAIEKVSSSQASIESQLAGLEARKKVLTDLEQSFEGYARGPRTVLEARTKGTLTGIEGSVGELLSSDPKYIPAVAAAIGGALENIVVQDENAAKKAISMLRAAKSGRATFLPLNLIRPREINSRVTSIVRSMPGVRPLLEVVRFPEKVAVCAKYLVGRVVLADTMDIALEFMKASGWATRVVTLSGETLDPGGAITGGDAPRHESIFRRKQEILDITRAMERLDQELAQVQSQRRSLERERQDLEDRLDKARADVSLRQSQAARLAEGQSRLQASVAALSAEIEERALAVRPLSREVERLKVDLENILSQESDLSMKMASMEAELRQSEEKMQEILARDRELSERVRNLASEKESVDRDLSFVLRQRESFSSEKNSLTRQIEEESREISRQEGLLNEATSEERELAQRVQSLDVRVKELTDRFQDAVAEREAVVGRIADLRTELERADRDRTALETRLNEWEDEMESLEAAHKETLSYIASEFGVINPDELPTERISRSSGVARMEQLDSALKALGSVNLKAEEELSELSDRIETIIKEKDDVLMAIEEIRKTQEHVDKEMQDRFLDTFRLVSDNFGQVFRDLFGGGDGELRLMEETMGVEVVAAPPGRRQKNINLLSGGERSLCGIALILAILSVRPSPMIVLDEVDTALDEVNVARFGGFLKRYSKDTQFLVITHQKATMEAADLLYGVTMDEPGVSRVFGMRLGSVQ